VHADRRTDVSVPELAREAARRALEDAGIRARDVDAVVFGSGPESWEGVNRPEGWIGPALGVPGKPILRVHTGGTTGAAATIAAFYHVTSGMFDVVLAVACDKPSERVAGGLPDDEAGAGFTLDTRELAAMQARQYIDRHYPEVREEHGAMVVAKNRGNAAKNPFAQVRTPVAAKDVMASPPVATPLKELDCPPLADGAAALVIADERRARKIASRPAWFAGLGTCSAGAFMPDFDMAYPEPCVRAAQIAYQMAWIYEPLRELDLVEVYDAFSFQELIWTEALGFCNPGEGGKMVEQGITAMDGEFPVNPSGGILSANPGGAGAMLRQLEAALQVMGRAGEHQVPGVKKAMAHSWGGALQFSTVTIFSHRM
jgi:acetyl-CoA C-acetyltransferase